MQESIRHIQNHLPAVCVTKHKNPQKGKRPFEEEEEEEEYEEIEKKNKDLFGNVFETSVRNNAPRQNQYEIPTRADSGAEHPIISQIKREA